MTKKHFEAIARAISRSTLSYGDKLVVAECIACELATVNPRFDWDRFVVACSGDSYGRNSG